MNSRTSRLSGKCGELIAAFLQCTTKWEEAVILRGKGSGNQFPHASAHVVVMPPGTVLRLAKPIEGIAVKPGRRGDDAEAGIYPTPR